MAGACLVCTRADRREYKIIFGSAWREHAPFVFDLGCRHCGNLVRDVSNVLLFENSKSQSTNAGCDSKQLNKEVTDARVTTPVSNLS